MSHNRHPSRDALLRDGLDHLRHTTGVSLEEFAFTLNDLVHSMTPAKAADMPMLRSFRVVNGESTRAIGSWNKRVQRWAIGSDDGGTEMPAWLEEAWVTALEEHGDTTTRVELARRHGFMGVRRPESTDKPSTAFAAMGSVSTEVGEVMGVVARMLENGRLDEEDRQYMQAAYTEIDDSVAALMHLRKLIEIQVEGKTVGLKAVQ